MADPVGDIANAGLGLGAMMLYGVGFTAGILAVGMVANNLTVGVGNTIKSRVMG